ncbi:hypothetical protein BGX34_003386 [Mortierella sp. NVP85]|nr:hypothetical protein BGX34_003386 [Mortierella sp. NVP85]
MPKEQGPDENTRTMHIESLGHTKHPKGIKYKMLGAKDISPSQANDLKGFRESLKSKPSIHYQGVWETVVKAQQIYDTWTRYMDKSRSREPAPQKQNENDPTIA